jgi:hypothetical protein
MQIREGAYFQAFVLPSHFWLLLLPFCFKRFLLTSSSFQTKGKKNTMKKKKTIKKKKMQKNEGIYLFSNTKKKKNIKKGGSLHLVKQKKKKKPQRKKDHRQEKEM